MSATALAAGYFADVCFGDPRRLHPVAGFGRAALCAEALVYRPTRARGMAFAGTLVPLAAGIGEVAARLASRAPLGPEAVLAVATWAALGGRSLRTVATQLAAQVECGDLAAARRVLPALCGRDPELLTRAELSRAALESVAENTSDAVVGPLVFAAVAGPAGVLAYRAANTLDAMVGHRNHRYADFGWAAAKLDDALNWLPARLSAVLAAVCAPIVGGSPRGTWRVARRDGGKHPSPNAGQVEAAFAGALGVRLGGPLSYGGTAEVRPYMGSGRTPAPSDVRRAVALSRAVSVTAALTCALIRFILTRATTTGHRA